MAPDLITDGASQAPVAPVQARARQRRRRVVKDDPDNRILKCAVAGRAEVIVTGDKALLELKLYEKIRILNLREYLGTP